MGKLLKTLCLFFIAATANAESFKFVSPNVYEDLTKKQQQAYTQQLLKTWANYESRLSNGVAESQFQLFETAHAESNRCVLGGAILQTVQVGKKYLCPTKGRSCENKSDSFQCGEIFVSKCVNRDPPDQISQRCYEASKETYFRPVDYNKMAMDMALTYNEICGYDSKNNANDCKIFAERLNHVSYSTTPKYALPSEINSKDTIGYDESSELSGFKSLSDIEAKGSINCKTGLKTLKNRKEPFPIFNPKDTCIYDRNKAILSDLAKNGCVKGKALPLLINTSIRSKEQHTLLLSEESTEIPGIITSITKDSQRAKDDVVYIFTMVKPDIHKQPVSLVETRYNIRKKANKYYLLPYNNTDAPGTEVSITNDTRANSQIEHVYSTNGLNFIAGKMILAQNCSIASDLKKLPQYASSISSSSKRNSGNK